MTPGPSLFNRISVGAGLAFLSAPIVLLVIYAFNASRLVTVWGGWSVRWFRALADDQAMLDAVSVSLRVGLISASVATVLALLAALSLARGKAFPTRRLFSSLVYAPLSLPDVIVGLSLLLLFVALGLPRGFWTVTLGHTTMTLCYATVVIQARLASVDPSLEEAARNLGCPPATAFLKVTLPVIAPAVAAAWMLAFTLSLDDLVVASFTSGPGATTLPMRLYSAVRLGVNPEINAVSTLLIGAVAIGVSLAGLAMRRRPEA